MKKRLIISFLIVIGVLATLFVPLIEFIDLGFLDQIAIWIHWPLFGAGFFGDWGIGSILFVAFWYGIIIAIEMTFIYNVIALIQNRLK